MTQDIYTALRGLLILTLLAAPVVALVLYAICAQAGESSRIEEEQAEMVRRWARLSEADHE